MGAESRWETGSIWTFAEFEVMETFKGSPPRTLRVRLPGGRVAHLEMKVEGVPRFAAGDEVVLFIERTSAGDYGLTSWAQGTFRVHRDAAGDSRLTQDSSRFAVFDTHTHQFATSGIRDLPLSEFRVALSIAFSVPLPAEQERQR